MEDKFQLLMSGYFIGSLTDNEQLELKNHLESTPPDRQIFEDYHLLWEHSGQHALTIPIDTEVDLKQTKRKIIFGRTSFLRQMQRVAAVLFLAVLLSTIYIYSFDHSSNSKLWNHSVVLQEISSVYGTRSQFLLPDGTKVMLNSGSTLKFPVVFNGDTRKVELIGEAFFDVAPNPAKPFIVKAKDIDIKVLGTAFDLQAYPESDEISTTLLHGKVVLEREAGGETRQLAELSPSERAVFKVTEKTIKISREEDIDKYIGWKDNKLVFYNDPIQEVAEKLGIWYNVKVVLGNSNLKRYRFTATFTDEPIEQVLNLLCKSSPIRYRIVKASKLADNSFSKREIIFN